MSKLKAIAFLILVIIGVAALLGGGCSHKYVQITKPDKTEIMVDFGEIMKDQNAQHITITVDPDSGAYTFTVGAINSETSPIVPELLKAVYEMGRRAGGV